MVRRLSSSICNCVAFVSAAPCSIFKKAIIGQGVCNGQKIQPKNIDFAHPHIGFDHKDQKIKVTSKIITLANYYLALPSVIFS